MVERISKFFTNWGVYLALIFAWILLVTQGYVIENKNKRIKLLETENIALKELVSGPVEMTELYGVSMDTYSIVPSIQIKHK